MDAAKRQEAATRLANAYVGEPISPLTEQYDGIDIVDAYEIQRLQMEARIADGLTIKGHKVGLSSLAMQRQLGVNQPDYGHLTDRMFFLEGQPIPAGAFLQPKIEPEIAFVLSKPLKGPGVTAAEAICAIEYVLPALEIIDSRIKDWKIGIVDTIADNASSGGVVLGSRALRVDDLDLRLMGCVLHRDSVVVETGAGAAVLGSPVNSLVWLANTLGPLGITLEPGHVVLPGSMTKAVEVSPGATFTATYSDLGSVTARFAKEA